MPIKLVADELGITSVFYDNSSAMLTINTFDNSDYTFSMTPKLNIVKYEHKVYFDINFAIKKMKAQDLVINSPDVEEIKISQFSLNPNVVSVVLYSNNNFNP